MTIYEAVPNTDGQIITPVRKNPPILPEPRSSRTAPPPRRGIPVSRFRTPSRPISPPVHIPIPRASIPGTSSLQSKQTLVSENDPNEKLKLQEAAARRCRAVNSGAPNIPATIPRMLDQRGTTRRLDYVVSKEERASAEAGRKENVNKMSLSYIMGSQSTTQSLSYIPDVEKVVGNFEFGQSMGATDMLSFRAGRTLPPLPTGGAGYRRNHPHMMASSPFATPRCVPKVASLSLSNLEHAAVTTLASLNHRLDSNKSNSPSTFAPIHNPKTPAPTHQSLETSTRKRLSCLISTPTPVPNFKSPVSSKSELEPATKRICMESLLRPTPNPSSSTPRPASTPALITPRTQTIGLLMTQGPSHHKENLASDDNHGPSTPAPPSDVYPSPPVSPSYESSPTRSIPIPLVPRTPLPSRPTPAPEPQAQLLFFDHEAYSPLPLPSEPLPRSSSAPPISSRSSLSLSPSPHSRLLPRKNFACRVWKLHSPRSTINGASTLDPSNPPEYLVLIRSDDHSNPRQSSTSSTSDAGMGRWCGVMNGRDDMDEIRKLFQ
ncbi:hypothetical protein DSL72_008338 [Monilinia vaccinii-corymbosi]|uniref:Uncharacterized protein n=1 Tax=Monilinia vaccinii-corymbosi TaxID=61207 RepID=A0A8A3PJI9_9HELO|nr:hypothetical protein DSL72_008338 [Monilinia vaccinii-corymbosi]